MENNESDKITLDVSPQDRAENLLDTIADLQGLVNQLKSENKDITKELNKFRMGMFIPIITDQLDVRPINTRNKWAFSQIEASHGSEAAQLTFHAICDLAAECGELIEVTKSKKSIKVSLEKKDSAKKAEVEKIRANASPEAKKKRVLLSQMEKQVVNVRKRFPHATMKELIPIASMFLVGSSEAEIREAIEAIFAKESQGTKDKK